MDKYRAVTEIVDGSICIAAGIGGMTLGATLAVVYPQHCAKSILSTYPVSAVLISYGKKRYRRGIHGYQPYANPYQNIPIGRHPLDGLAMVNPYRLVD